MSNLTVRSKIRVHWTTNPADMGYDGTPTGGKLGAWRTSNDYKLCSVREAEHFDYALSQRIDHGTYRIISYQYNGIEIDASELYNIVSVADRPKDL